MKLTEHSAMKTTELAVIFKNGKLPSIPRDPIYKKWGHDSYITEQKNDLCLAGELAELDRVDTTLLNTTDKTDAATAGLDVTVRLPPIKTLLALALSYNLIYTTFNGIQNIQSSINQEKGLGMTTMAIAYGVSPFAAPFGPTLLRTIGCKKLLLASWISMAVFIASHFYTSFYTLVPGAVILGFVSAHVGAIGIIYTTAISDSYVQTHNLSPERRPGILSLFNGVFFAFWEATQVTGNLISSLVFSSQDPSTPADELATETNICGAAMCHASSGNATAIVRPAQETVYILLSVFLACIAVGFLITAVFLPQILTAGASVRKTVCQEFASCYRMYLDKRCLLLVPLYFAQAAMLMFLFTGFTKAYISCTLGVKWVGFIMMVYGTSTAICATVINSLARFLDRKLLIVAFILIDCSILVTLLLWEPTQDNVKIVLFSIAAVAGVSEGISQPQFNTLISIIFKDKLVPAFVAYIMTKNLAAAVSMGLSSFICTYHRLYMGLTLYALGFIGYVATEAALYRRSKVAPAA